MLDILICLLIMFPIGYFLALMVSGGFPKHWWGHLLQILAGLAIACLIMGMLYAEADHDSEEYNSGICEVCGGDYKFSGATAYRTSRKYYYTCEDCDHTISTNSLMN